MSIEIQWDICRAVMTTERVAEFLKERESMFNNWGTHGMQYNLGPAGADIDDFPLRIDYDPNAGAAAIQWIPEGLVGSSPNNSHNGPIKVLEDSGAPLVEVPAELVRSDFDTARRAAAEYVETGQRPANVEWSPV